jgi:UDP-N-acetylmuramoyl-tripeptide--D-alanyl-D-alanine ligase
MPLFTLQEIIEVTGAKPVRLPKGSMPVARLCADSRQVRKGDLFVAFRGERVDGHAFLDAARAKGAVGALIEDELKLPVESGAPRGRSFCGLVVPDVLVAFQQLAHHHRSRFRIPLVAVTGSNGKTTTKEMVAAVLAETRTVLKTEGNLNNRIGMPQTLFRLTRRHKAAVIEMGVDNVGQTARLCEIARPTHGLITNIGPDHLEFFGTMDNSAKAKGELLDYLPQDGAVALNADDPYFPYLRSRARCRVVSFGLSAQADVRAFDLQDSRPAGAAFALALPGRRQRTPVRLRVHGTHNVCNALAAAAIGHALSIPAATIARGLGRFRPAEMRSQVETRHGVTIINDCYNANPASMTAAIDLLAGLGAGKRTVAVLGDMLELGPSAAAMHRDVGRHLAKKGIAMLVACGALGREIGEGAREGGLDSGQVRCAADSEEAATRLKGLVRRGDVVLVKASRGMKLEKVVEALRRKG